MASACFSHAFRLLFACFSLAFRFDLEAAAAAEAFKVASEEVQRAAPIKAMAEARLEAKEEAPRGVLEPLGMAGHADGHGGSQEAGHGESEAAIESK